MDRIKKILIIHNKYRYLGGEDSVVNDEISLLQSKGHDVQLFSKTNLSIANTKSPQLFFDTIWSRKTNIELTDTINKRKPDIIHIHNTFPLISPSVYYTAKNLKIPVVQTLHNFRLMCLKALLLRNNAICEDCIGKTPWRGLIHKCYHDSFLRSLAIFSMLTTHRALGTYRKHINQYIALSEFSKKLFIKGGLPAEKISIKPNFVAIGKPISSNRSGLLYVGRLSPEKGFNILVKALANQNSIRASIIGEGPEQALTPHTETTNLEYLGWLDSHSVYKHMRNSQFIVIPSICYENFPRTLVEAYACELPVIASNIGPLGQLVKDGKTGLLFKPGSADDLLRKIQWAVNNPNKIRKMGENARKYYEQYYNVETNYQILKNIYYKALTLTTS